MLIIIHRVVMQATMANMRGRRYDPVKRENGRDRIVDGAWLPARSNSMACAPDDGGSVRNVGG